VNQLKPLVVLAVLAGVLYWVYAHINSGPVTMPAGVSPGWEKGPQVDMPGDAIAGTPAASGNDSAAPSEAGHHDHAHDHAHDGAPHNAATTAAAAPPPAAITTPPTASIAASPPPTAAPDVSAAPEEQPAAAEAASGTKPAGEGGAFAQSLPESLRTSANAAVAPAGKSQFALVREAVEQDLTQQKYVEALLQLSPWYNSPQLSPSESEQLNKLLDELSGTVIYSTQHWLKPAREIKGGETLESIADEHHVPWQLLAKINGIEDPSTLAPGEKIKLVQGPFHAVISLSQQELTLSVGGMYAGRFPIGLGTDNAPTEGNFEVTAKVSDPVYRGADRTIESGDPTNPLGQRLLALGDRLAIHGTSEREVKGRSDLRGSISLSQRDAADVFDILVEGSKVTIRK
jgi:lipoprotein-anchoring transpeptidase ErfK/SrfK